MAKLGNLHRARLVVGIALLLVAAAGIGYPIWWKLHSDQGAQRLLQQYRSETTIPGRSSTTIACNASTGPGILSIPAIGLIAPVQQGVDDSVLNVSIGHNPSTAWPGTSGASLLSAHDVSFFSRIDELKPGQTITYSVGCASYVFRVSKGIVTKVGAPIDVPAKGSLILDTCWPTNALWYTSQRYIVTAQYVSTVPTSSLSKTGAAPTALPEVLLHVNLPSGLDQASLSLSANSQIMGTLSFDGAPAGVFIQSNAPLQFEASSLTLWFAAIHTLEANQPSWWNTFAPGVPYPSRLAGAPLRSTGALQITEQVNGTTPVGATLVGALNGVQVTLHAKVSSGNIAIDSYTLS